MHYAPYILSSVHGADLSTNYERCMWDVPYLLRVEVVLRLYMFHTKFHTEGSGDGIPFLQ